MRRLGSTARRVGQVLACFGVVVTVAGACASETRYDDEPATGGFAGALPGTGGALTSTGGFPVATGGFPVATGGAAGGGAGGATGGISGGGGAMDAGMTCEVHTGPPILDVTTLPECDNADLLMCGDGRCLAVAAVPEDARDLLAPCTAENEVCVPEHFIETGGSFLVDSCRSVGDTEGRCLSLCIPQVAEQADLLPQATCAETERCAPCFDPRTGEDTGACRQGCDTGPAEAPKTFAKCCGDVGSCVPSSVVPEADRSLLGPDTCTGTDELCAPDTLSDSSFVPTACESLAGAEGRCLPACLPDVAAQADLLPQATCAAGELCAPCYDPLTGESTGACERGTDMPVDPPVVFDECCSTKGACVPTDILTDEQEGQLGPDTCEDGALCAPKVLASPGQRAASCRSIGDAEGRCLPTCVPLVAEQGDRLPRATCAEDELCAPCFDPITGEDTGACSQNGDEPAEPAYTFPKCCSGLGVCVSTSLVPTEQQALLGKDTCTATDVLCAPQNLASDPDARPASCRTFDPQDREGRCLPACIPDVAARAEQLLQETCATGELCAPCYDPVSGGPTGSCEINGDAPVDPDPGTFVECGASVLNFPDVEGRCVPPHLVDPAQAGLLDPHENCQSGEICAPCEFPPGTPTGACPP